MFWLKATVLCSTLSLVLSTSNSVTDRLDCWLGDELPEYSQCLDLGCQWDDNTTAAAPFCFFQPPKSYGYQTTGPSVASFDGFSLDLWRIQSKPRFPGSVDQIKFDVQYLTDNIVRIKLWDPASKRYEVPVQDKFPLLRQRKHRTDPSKSSVKVVYQDDDDGFRFQVKRKSNDVSIFDTAIGGLTFSEQFLQIAGYLPSDNVYGLGESAHPSLRHDMNYKSWALFTRDNPPFEGFTNSYGVHPFYTCLEENGTAHGVLLLNSNAMEFTLLPAPAISVRTVGGVLDLFFFVGDNPEHVVQLYTELIGRPFMPPYWALGFQLCRYGYHNLSDVQDVVKRNRMANIPQDVQYIDIDYMDQFKDFTWDKNLFGGLDDYVNTTKQEGLRWVFILDPALLATDSTYVPYVDGEVRDLFVHWPDDIPPSKRSNPPSVDLSHGFIYGSVWPKGPVAFPDFFKNGTAEWWKNSIQLLYRDLKFDGLWIDMNEPSNFLTNNKNGDNRDSFNAESILDDLTWNLDCPPNQFDDPDYKPLAVRLWGNGSRLSDRTLCMASVHGDQKQYRHYDVHSLYGWSETEPTMRAVRDLTGHRGMVFSRSTYPSSGVHGGHWLGDIQSRWVDMHRSIIGILEFNLFGIPYTGTDICGFGGVTTPEMCQRWTQLGAFYPLARNHNGFGNPPQDPAYFGGEVTAASRRALNVRYRLLPYLYSLFFLAHLHGGTVARPVFHEYPTDPVTHGIDTQFLWGPSLLVSPILQEGQTDVDAYLPDDTWYDYYTGHLLTTKAANITIHSPPDIPLHVRGGTVLPTQDPGLNTKESRLNQFSLLVYPKKSQALGMLFWDDGISQDTVEKNEYILLTFVVNNRTMTIINQSPPSDNDLSFVIRDIQVCGVKPTVRKSFARARRSGIGPLNNCLTVTTNLPVTKELQTTVISW